MKNIKSYDNFINEERGWKFGPSKLGEVSNKVELEKGDCVIITADKVDMKDIDYSRTAKTWWGKNIYSLKNEFKSDFIWKKGNVILISAGDDKGYLGGGGPNEDFVYSMSPYLVDISRSDDAQSYRREMIDILVDQGMAKVVKYEELPNDFRKEFELYIKEDRVSDATRDNVCEVFGQNIGLDHKWYKVIKVSYYNKNLRNGYVISIIRNMKEEEFILSKEELGACSFRTKNSDIDGDPFNPNFSSTLY